MKFTANIDADDIIWDLLWKSVLLLIWWLRTTFGGGLTTLQTLILITGRRWRTRLFWGRNLRQLSCCLGFFFVVNYTFSLLPFLSQRIIFKSVEELSVFIKCRKHRLCCIWRILTRTESALVRITQRLHIQQIWLRFCLVQEWMRNPCSKFLIIFKFNSLFVGFVS